MQPKLKIITGPMFAGKTTKLISLKRNVCEIDNVLMINHVLDNRYTNGDFITSHSNEVETCVKTSRLSNIISTPEYLSAPHIFIDEGQFFEPSDLVSFVIDCLFINKKNVVIAGLNASVNMGDLGGLYLLFKYADEIIILKGNCSFCENISSSNIVEGISSRTFTDNPNIQFSKINEYNFKPVCRDCWFKKADIFSM